MCPKTPFGLRRRKAFPCRQNGILRGERALLRQDRPDESWSEKNIALFAIKSPEKFRFYHCNIYNHIVL